MLAGNGFEMSMHHRRTFSALATLIALGVTLAGVTTMAAQSTQTLATSSSKPIALGAGPVNVTLASPQSESLSARLADVRQNQKVYLVAKGLRTDAQPEVLYQLYLGLPAGAAPKADDIYFVGSLNFFNAQTPVPPQGDSRLHSFDVTDLIQALRARKSLGDSTTVTIVPTNRPNAAAKPQIGEIALVAQ